MAIKSLLPLHLLLLLLLPLLLLSTAVQTCGAVRSSASFSRKTEAVGGWMPIMDVDGRHVREIAEFAVSEYNAKRHAGFALSRVVRGETQVVAGVVYRLVLQVKDKNGSAAAAAAYEATVLEKAWVKSLELTSFVPIKKP